MDHLHSLFDRSLDAVVGMDHLGRVIAWNRAAETIFGWSQEEAMGRDMSELIVPPEHRENHERGLKHYNATGEGPVLEQRVQITALHRSGAIFPVELSIFAMKQAEGDVFYAFVRSRKREEEFRRELELRAQEAEVLFSASEALLEDISPEDFTRLCLAKVCEVARLEAAHMFYVRSTTDGPRLVSSGIWHLSDEHFRPVIEDTAARRFARGEGAPGAAWARGEHVYIADIPHAPNFSRRASFTQVGLTQAVAVPILLGTETYAVMEFFGKPDSRVDADLFRLLRTLARNIGLTIQKKESAEQRELLRRELAHRVGNSMTILSAIFRATAKSAESVEELAASFSVALQSVARAHRDIARATRTVTLLSLVEEAFALLPNRERVTMDVPALLVLPDAALPLSLLLVELVTNHMKYCHEADLGRIDLRVSVEAAADRMEIHWRETCRIAETPSAPASGYGSFLIKAMIEDRLGGTFERQIGDAGVTCQVRVPASAAVGAAEAGPAPV
jgi:PAS domain S-box-containing protein